MKTKHFKNIALLFAGTVLFGGLLVPSSYATVTFQSASLTAGVGDDKKKNAVDATAAISISGNVMTVVLTDLYANPGSVGNVLSGITIDIPGVAAVSSSLGANSATTADVAGDGTYTPFTTAGSDITKTGKYGGWTVSGSTTIKLSALGTGQPQYLILGPDASGAGPNAFTDLDGVGYSGKGDGSIAGNGPHNPFILGTETFYFNLTAASSISDKDIQSAVFLFGTSGDYSSSTMISSVPEPATIAAGSFLLLPLGVSIIRSVRKSRIA